ncbi:acyltransferase family protein [Mucilaginibacter gilvus]|uniref:Acyltransferase n=1 Tax=Mucilaginibacter gilvus TaxID=2305909 RepID=A0A3S3VKB9_9SPHI|nr:acyltransferase [Mucilaginibacter gilvus]RWY50199.1 acyltransferase [Mucilaginibacter gilvus]
MGKIRTLLALSVVMFHCGSIFGVTLIGGGLPVQAFFIISGFYMSMVLNEKYIGANNSYKLFLSNRLLRLYPIYWVVLILTVLGGVLLAAKAHTIHINKFEGYFALQGYVPSVAFMIINQVVIFGQDLVYSLAIDPANGHLFFTTLAENGKPPLTTLLMVPPAWTLGVELTFYLVAPFILRRKAGIIVSLIVLSFLLRVCLLYMYGSAVELWMYKFFPTSLMFFLLGYVCYRMYVRLKNVKLNNKLGYVVLILLVLETFLYPYLPDFRLAYFPFGFLDTLYLTSITFAVPFLFIHFKSNTLDNKIGELSYPIYICHKLFFYILRSMHFLSGQFFGLYVVIGTIIFAILLTKLVTLPIEKYRQSRLIRQRSNG